MYNTIHVFQGGEKAEQAESFIAAINDATCQLLPKNDSFQVRILTVAQIKTLSWSPRTLIEWLLISHAHFIIAHVHQGRSSNDCGQLGWNMVDLEEQLRRLYDHPGFPNGIQLSCPVFLQNKGEYLRNVLDLITNTVYFIYIGNTADATFLIIQRILIMGKANENQLLELYILCLYYVYI